MPWWNRARTEERKAQENAALVASLSQAFGQALGQVLQAQAEQIKSSLAVLGTLNELSAKKASQILGSRGGKKSAEKRAQKRARAQEPSCRLCKNTHAKGVTLAEIDAHRQHEAQERELLQLSPPEQTSADQMVN